MKRTYHPLALNKSNAVKTKAALHAWVQEHESCAACWWNPNLHRTDEYRTRVDVHHLIKQDRSHEPCNLLRLCNKCHDLAEGHTIRENGIALPKLTLGMCLWLKVECDSENWNPGRLLELWHRASLPELEPVPEVFLRERQRR